MRALRSLLSEARAHNLLAPLFFDALALVVVGVFFAMFWIATPGDPSPEPPLAAPHAAPASLAPASVADGRNGDGR